MQTRSGQDAPRRLWAITSYFNPLHYQRRLENYRTFRWRLQVPLATVELSFGDDFQLGPEDAEILLQLRGQDVMWHKERLLNIALAALPRDCDQVAWLDCDIVFERPDWAGQASRLLGKQPLLQLFDKRHDLALNAGVERSSAAIELTSLSMASKVATGRMSYEDFRAAGRQGCSGLAWAARREVLAGDGFYESCILGSGSRAMACAAYGRFDDAVAYLRMNPRRADHYRSWAHSYFKRVRGNVGCLAGGVFHLWHGTLTNRGYGRRHEDFERFDFDPVRDIAALANRCLHWNSRKTDMHCYVRSYLASRKEDG